MIKMIAKLATAIILIVWLVNSGKLDFSLVKQLITNSNNWIYAIIIYFCQVSLSGARWRLILKTRSNKPFPIRKVIGLTWIGQFFNTFLPGAVSGDLIKLVYAKDLDKEMPKTFFNNVSDH